MVDSNVRKVTLRDARPCLIGQTESIKSYMICENSSVLSKASFLVPEGC